jgi:hypothetical protein
MKLKEENIKDISTTYDVHEKYGCLRILKAKENDEIVWYLINDNYGENIMVMSRDYVRVKNSFDTIVAGGELSC